MTNQERYIELQYPVVFEAGELIGPLEIGGFLGAWNDGDHTKVYWQASEWSEDVIEHIRRALKMAGVTVTSSDVVVRDLPIKDWNALWSASVVPLWIGARIVIRPSWHQITVSPGTIEIILDPKQAFGTGHHATTHLLIEWLPELIKGGEDVLDVGTGSGILAMVALRCGARSALGIEPDPVALECAEGYANDNGFAHEFVLQRKAFDELSTARTFQVILANIDKPTIFQSSHAFKRFGDPSGSILLISGILSDDRQEIEDAFSNEGWNVSEQREKEGWVAMMFMLQRDCS